MATSKIQYYGTGKRKSSIARVYLRPGSGQININKRSMDDYFVSDALKMIIIQPIALTESADKFDIYANISGGGLTASVSATASALLMCGCPGE